MARKASVVGEVSRAEIIVLIQGRQNEVTGSLEEIVYKKIDLPYPRDLPQAHD